MTLSIGRILLSILLFAAWEAALFAAAIPLARVCRFGRFRRAEEQLLAVLAIEIAIEASIAGILSFTRLNSQPLYWMAAALCLAGALAFGRARGAIVDFARAIPRLEIARYPRTAAVIAALTVPLLLLSFRPVEEIDSMNYLHFLIEWMANRATPYTFATNYVAFWELSFLPAWMVTRVDLFFPLLALKAVAVLALALWLVGRALGLRRGLLLWAVFGAVALRHLWFECSGVPTLKNDALHGAGFAMLTLAVMRAARRRPSRADAALLAFGCAFACVKYTGLFVAVLALAVVLLQQRKWRPAAMAIGFTLVTSGHYYLRSALAYGNPFYPFQINFAFVHLPGTADLSATSILYSLRDPLAWRLLLLPPGVISPAGLLFPATLTGTLVAGAWLCLRRPPGARKYVALMLLAGWALYFRSVYSASAWPGDLNFLRSNLNTIRYVDGVLGVSELFLAALLLRWPRLAAALVAINAVSRLWLLYPHIPGAIFPPRFVLGSAFGSLLVLLAIAPLARRTRAATAAAAATAVLIAGCPFAVERNRALWTTYWNPLKPSLAAARSAGLWHLALENAGYFAGHFVAAGNPVDPRVRSVFARELEAIPPASRPAYLAVLPTPGSPPFPPDRVAAGYTPKSITSGGILFFR